MSSYPIPSRLQIALETAPANLPRVSVDLNTAVEQAVETLLWSETEANTEEPFDQLGYVPSDLTPEAVGEIRDAVTGFVQGVDSEQPHLFQRVALAMGITSDDTLGSFVGHDFILTANRHGAGFWDRGLGELGEALTEAARGSGYSLYVGDDGKLYVS